MDDLEYEVWRPVEGLENYYMVSSFGRVKSLARPKKMWPCLIVMSKEKMMTPSINNVTGYATVSLSLSNIQKKEYIHRIVARAFLDNPYNRYCVNHLDGNRSNNSVDNLCWATTSENKLHGYYYGISRPTAGEIHRNAQLRNTDVKVIRFLINHFRLKNTEIGQMFDVSEKIIRLIRRGKTWKCVA